MYQLFVTHKIKVRANICHFRSYESLLASWEKFTSRKKMKPIEIRHCMEKEVMNISEENVWIHETYENSTSTKTVVLYVTGKIKY